MGDNSNNKLDRPRSASPFSDFVCIPNGLFPSFPLLISHGGHVLAVETHPAGSGLA